MMENGGLFTVGETLQWAVLFLGKEKRLEIDLLLAHTLNSSRERLLAYPEEILTLDQQNKFKEMVEHFQKGEPLQYLLGKQSFMGLDFVINKNVLIPRSDTEVLVEEIMKIAQGLEKPLRILDLCTGSGAIAVSLAKHIKDVEIWATDISTEALAVAKTNATNNQVDQQITFLQGDLFEALEKEKFDIIVSNPPYIATWEIEELEEQVKREPRIALWGGEDGLDFYRRITNQAPDYFKTHGILLMEIGYLQGGRVKELCEANEFKEIEVIKDWSGNDRVVKGQYL